MQLAVEQSNRFKKYEAFSFGVEWENSEIMFTDY
jgi:hypothetical protein